MGEQHELHRVEAASGLQALLGWSADGPQPLLLEEGAPPLRREAWLMDADEQPRRLHATIGSYTTPGGQRRFMAIVQDRTMEDERDLARLQVGALMDTAGVGLATFQSSSGWVRQHAPADQAPADATMLQSIKREFVLPDSLPDYERLQQALRQAQRAEVRYAIRHPELGERWLLTRVEPATLASGERTTSVVTLDVTEQHRSQVRSEQLLHEMSTILESSTAGIALLRGSVLARCNQRFAAMLGLGAELAGCEMSVSTPPRLSARAISRTLPSTSRERSSEPTSNEMRPPNPCICRLASAWCGCDGRPG